MVWKSFIFLDMKMNLWLHELVAFVIFKNICTLLNSDINIFWEGNLSKLFQPLLSTDNYLKSKIFLPKFTVEVFLFRVYSFSGVAGCARKEQAVIKFVHTPSISLSVSTPFIMFYLKYQLKKVIQRAMKAGIILHINIILLQNINHIKINNLP